MTLAKLIDIFRRQSHFTASYSHLYQCLFATVADWLETESNDKVVQWLVEASFERSPLETSLLLMAGMHREVLLNSPGTEELRTYYPSVGGTKPYTDEDLPRIFRHAVESKMNNLTSTLQNDTVQTNETGRGIIWLFPTILTRWSSIHLVDLGASAGLNLVADQRRFTLLDQSRNDSVSLGLAKSPQFHVNCEPNMPHFWERTEPPIPSILSRNGCDLKPFTLKTESDRATLESFIWADQVERLHRLDEGIEAYKMVATRMPITVWPVNLPDDLPGFLDSLPLKEDAPVVIYNTYMSSYLRDQGKDMCVHIENWAVEQKHPVLWVQAEPARGGMEAKHGDHWCAWTVDLWEPKKGRCHWHIAWVHPHGTRVKWMDSGLTSFVNYFAL
jgi:hypothetical protein